MFRLIRRLRGQRRAALRDSPARSDSPEARAATESDRP